ncbi:MAG TPA: hypothetical protein VFP36_06240 [Usitatibacter sp.]|nr:hypothetical protein [Usitatibacter sp.]
MTPGRTRSSWLAGMAGVLAFAAAAETAPVESRSAVEQKEALVRRLLTDSPAVQRIDASGNAQAQAFFRDARARHEEALRLIAAADLARAEKELNEALWLAGKARQLVPDPMLRAIELRFQNRSLTRAIEALRDAYAQHRARAAGVAAASLPPDSVLVRTRERLEQADALAASENVHEANALLRAAERDLMLAATDALGSATVRVSTRFEKPADEYAYEAARRAGYVELLPIARVQLDPGRDAVAAMERHAAASASWNERAEKHAARHEYAAALEAMRNSTVALQNALAAAGLVVPRETAAR